MCNCGKNKQPKTPPAQGGKMASQQFALIQPNGTRTTYGSHLEAAAENARTGGRGQVKPV